MPRKLPITFPLAMKISVVTPIRAPHRFRYDLFPHRTNERTIESTDAPQRQYSKTVMLLKKDLSRRMIFLHKKRTPGRIC